MNHRFQQLCQDPARFAPMDALRIAEAEASIAGLPLNLRTPPENTLAPVPIRGVRRTKTAIEVDVSLIGMLGPLSSMPSAYSEFIAETGRRQTRGLLAFFEIFASRLTWMFLEASEKYNLTALLQWRRAKDTEVKGAMYALIGLGTDGLQHRVPQPADALLSYAGLLAERRRSAEGLSAMLSADLCTPVAIRQFQPRWTDISRSEQTHMDPSRPDNVRLGINVTAGKRFLDVSGCFRIVIGPVRKAMFRQLAPETPTMTRLLELTRLYVGPGLDFDVQVVLDRRDIPAVQLSADGPPCRLGWNCWVKSQPSDTDSGDALIRMA